jgi:cytochrome P450
MQTQTKKSNPLAPGPNWLELLAFFPILLEHGPHQFFAAIHKKYGDNAYFRYRGRQFFLNCVPDQIEQVHFQTGKEYIKGYAESLGIMGNGLLTSEGDFWQRQRKLAAPSFHQKRIAGYSETMLHYTLQHIEAWRDGEVLDVHEEMTKLTLKIVCKTLFDEEIGGRTKEVSGALAFLLEHYIRNLLYPKLLPVWVPTPNKRRAESATRLLREITTAIIQEHKEDPQKDDLLSTLIAAEDEDGNRMTDQQLQDEVMTLFLAGHETTASSLSWTFYLLSENPAAREKFLAEIQTVLCGRHPSYEDLPKLPFADAVVKESMRLYPPAWRVTRQPINDVELGGYHVPARTVVFMPQWIVQRDKRYFKDPDQFVPERWLSQETKTLPKFAYFPFGGGPRVCIGNGFATMEAIIVLVAVSQKFLVDVLPDAKIVPKASVTLRPKYGVRARVKRI